MALVGIISSFSRKKFSSLGEKKGNKTTNVPLLIRIKKRNRIDLKAKLAQIKIKAKRNTILSKPFLLRKSIIWKSKESIKVMIKINKSQNTLLNIA